MLSIIDRSIRTYDLTLTLTGNKQITLRSDCPIPMLTKDELSRMEQEILELHHTFIKNMGEEISHDNYIQLTKTDTISIALEGQRYSLTYTPESSFLQYSPLFYLDWLSAGMLVEVTGEAEHLARFVYKK